LGGGGGGGGGGDGGAGRFVNGKVATAATATQGGLRCSGVRTNDGLDILADHIIVCAGAYTAKLLADSGPAEPTLQAGDRLVAAAALSCTVRVLDPEKRMMHRSGPVVANELPHTAGKSAYELPSPGRGINSNIYMQPSLSRLIKTVCSNSISKRVLQIISSTLLREKPSLGLHSPPKMVNGPLMSLGYFEMRRNEWPRISMVTVSTGSR
jgi:hypothetical protein